MDMTNTSWNDTPTSLPQGGMNADNQAPITNGLIPESNPNSTDATAIGDVIQGGAKMFGDFVKSGATTIAGDTVGVSQDIQHKVADVLGYLTNADPKDLADYHKQIDNWFGGTKSTETIDKVKNAVSSGIDTVLPLLNLPGDNTSDVVGKAYSDYVGNPLHVLTSMAGQVVTGLTGMPAVGQSATDVGDLALPAKLGEYAGKGVANAVPLAKAIGKGTMNTITHDVWLDSEGNPVSAPDAKGTNADTVLKNSDGSYKYFSNKTDANGNPIPITKITSDGKPQYRDVSNQTNPDDARTAPWVNSQAINPKILYGMAAALGNHMMGGFLGDLGDLGLDLFAVKGVGDLYKGIKSQYAIEKTRWDKQFTMSPSEQQRMDSLNGGYPNNPFKNFTSADNINANYTPVNAGEPMPPPHSGGSTYEAGDPGASIVPPGQAPSAAARLLNGPPPDEANTVGRPGPGGLPGPGPNIRVFPRGVSISNPNTTNFWGNNSVASAMNARDLEKYTRWAGFKVGNQNVAQPLNASVPRKDFWGNGSLASADSSIGLNKYTRWNKPTKNEIQELAGLPQLTPAQQSLVDTHRAMMQFRPNSGELDWTNLVNQIRNGAHLLPQDTGIHVDNWKKAVSQAPTGESLKPSFPTKTNTLFKEPLNIESDADNPQTHAALIKEIQGATPVSSLSVSPEIYKVMQKIDDLTGHHKERVGILAEAIANRLGVPYDTSYALGQTAVLHDIGKIGISHQIIDSPNRLTDEQFRVIKAHPQIGQELLKLDQPPNQTAITQAITHHEKWSGGGYPYELSGNQIPLSGRITAGADIVDAMYNGRPYKKALPMSAVIDEIRRQRGLGLDPKVADVILRDAPSLELLMNSYNDVHGIAYHGSESQMQQGGNGMTQGQQQGSLHDDEDIPLKRIIADRESRAKAADNGHALPKALPQNEVRSTAPYNGETKPPGYKDVYDKLQSEYKPLFDKVSNGGKLTDAEDVKRLILRTRIDQLRQAGPDAFNPGRVSRSDAEALARHFMNLEKDNNIGAMQVKGTIIQGQGKDFWGNGTLRDWSQSNIQENHNRWSKIGKIGPTGEIFKTDMSGQQIPLSQVPEDRSLAGHTVAPDLMSNLNNYKRTTAEKIARELIDEQKNNSRLVDKIQAMKQPNLTPTHMELMRQMMLREKTGNEPLDANDVPLPFGTKGYNDREAQAYQHFRLEQAIQHYQEMLKNLKGQRNE